VNNAIARHCQGRPGALTTRSVAGIVKRIAILRGLSSDVHPTRFATLSVRICSKRAPNLRAIQELLGHERLSTTAALYAVDHSHSDCGLRQDAFRGRSEGGPEPGYVMNNIRVDGGCIRAEVCRPEDAGAGALVQLNRKENSRCEI